MTYIVTTNVVSVSYAVTLTLGCGSASGTVLEEDVEEEDDDKEGEDVSVGADDSVADEADLDERGTRRTKSMLSSSSSSTGSALRGSPRFDSRGVFLSPNPENIRSSGCANWPSLPRVYVTDLPWPSVTTKG